MDQNTSKRFFPGKTAFFIGASYFAVFIGQGIWRAIFQNFAIEELNISPVEMGIAYSIVSIPGFLSVTLGFIGTKIKLLRLLSISIVLIGLGLFSPCLFLVGNKFIDYKVANSCTTFILFGCLMILHLGFAAYYPTINTVFLIGVKNKHAIKRLSSLKSIGPLAGAIGAGVILFAMSAYGYFIKFAVVGITVFLIGVICVLTLPRKQYNKKQLRLRFKKRLLPYYLLNFLNGCRSAIFKTFTIYQLITKYHFDISSTAAIVLAGNLLTFTGYQLVGRLSKRYNSENLLAILYFIVCFNFLGFILIENPAILSLIYLLDSLVFCTSAITDSYPKIFYNGKELLGDLSIGVSLYYFGGILMPLIGGLLYARHDPTVFSLGSICALLAIFATRKLAIKNRDDDAILHQSKKARQKFVYEQ